MWNKVILYLGLPLVLVSSFCLRLKAFLQSEYANGWDGYFYLVQIKAIIEEGQMHSSDASLIYPLMLAIQYLLNDYVLTYKVTAALLSAFFSGLVFLFFWRRTGQMSWAFFFAAFTVFSPQLTFFAAQYPKNLLGVVFFLGFMIALSERRWLWLILVLCLNYFGHRLTIGLCLVLGTAFLFFHLIDRTQKRLNWNLNSWWIGLSLLLIISLSFLLPGLLQVSDFERFKGIIAEDAHFSTLSFWRTMDQGARLSSYWKLELLVTNLLFIGMVPYLFFKSTSTLGRAFLACLFLLIFPWFEWSLTGMSYRFFLVFILLIPMLVGFFPESAFKFQMLLIPFSIALIGLGCLSFSSYVPVKHDANYQLYDKVTSKVLNRIPVQPDLVIAHNALAEYFTFTTGIDAMPWLPEYEIPEDRLWRIATDIRAPELKTLAPEEAKDQIYRLGVNYFLLRESHWQQVLDQIEEEGDTTLYRHINTWRNPHKIRPGYLLKKKE